MNRRRMLSLTATLAAAAALLSAGHGASAPTAPQSASAHVASVPLATAAGCAGRFEATALPHTTTMRGGGARFYDSNGSGLGVGDLNGDGLLDAVLGNLGGTGTVLWNVGGLRFRPQLLEASGVAASQIRDVKLVDVDADGDLDITLTHTRGGVGVWLNARGRFRPEWLSGATTAAYTMQWADLAGRGELNLITASYDAALEAERGSEFLFASNGGVAVYGPVQGGGGDLSVRGTRLSTAAHTLALLPFDTTGDGRPELVVGHDFGKPDQVWTQGAGGWREIRPFARITRNTMGFSAADLDNDGTPELFASDMKPDFADPAALARWMPLIERTYERLQYNDVQRAENTLQVRTRSGRWRNAGYDRALDATGWSWSAQFGDLDNDGLEDLYVVNGMIDETVFSYLPRGELVERNRIFRGAGRGRLTPAAAWGLDATASGRSMVLADFDNDGRLDVLVNNVASPAMLYANRQCGAGGALEVDLRWSTRNTRALGATVRLVSDRATRRRDVASGSGYLSGTPARVHFGVPAGERPVTLHVTWPDGAVSALAAPPVGSRVTVTRRGGPL